MFTNRLRSKRRGAALVEFSILLPVFCVLVIGTIETCRGLYLRQSLKIAAYECARLGIIPEMTRETLQDQCNVILLSRKLKSFEFSCTPEDPRTLEYGDAFTVTVRLSAKDNALINGLFFRTKVFSESVTIMAEH